MERTIGTRKVSVSASMCVRVATRAWLARCGFMAPDPPSCLARGCCVSVPCSFAMTGCAAGAGSNPIVWRQCESSALAFLATDGTLQTQVSSGHCTARRIEIATCAVPHNLGNLQWSNWAPASHRDGFALKHPQRPLKFAQSRRTVCAQSIYRHACTSGHSAAPSAAGRTSAPRSTAASAAGAAPPAAASSADPWRNSHTKDIK